MVGEHQADLWDAPMAIWAWIVGLNHFGQPANHIGPIVLGLGGHMMNSLIAGVMFITLLSARRLRNELAAVMFGVAYGLVLWVIMRYGSWRCAPRRRRYSRRRR
jgi:hypothetical protein